MNTRAVVFGILTLSWPGLVLCQDVPDDTPPPGELRPPLGPERARRMGPGRPRPDGPGPDRPGADRPPGLHIPGLDPDRPPPPPRGPRWCDMTESERKAVTHFLEEHFPRLAVEMDQMQQSAPRKYEQRMNRVGGEMRRLMDINDRDPRRATDLIRERQVGLEIQALARKYRAADDDEKPRIRKSLRELVAKEFDNRMERRNMEVQQLETKLAELKGRLTQMESVREKMLDRRMRELLERKPKPPADDRDDDEPGAPPERQPHEEQEPD